MSQQINLFNPIFRKEKKLFSALTMAQGLAVLLVAVLALGMLEMRQSASLRRSVADADRQIAEQQRALLAFGKELPSPAQGAVLADEIVAAERRLQARRQLLAELQTGAGAAPAGYSPILAALARRTLQGVWLTGVAIDGQKGELLLKGRALNGELVPSYIVSLSGEPVFAGRSVRELKLALNEKEPKRVLDFSLSIPLGPRGNGGAT